MTAPSSEGAKRIHRDLLARVGMGEAAGVAACISLAENVTPRQIDVKALQTELIQTGGNLGQAMREINGIIVTEISHDKKYVNPEYTANALTIKNSATEFTRK